MCYKIITSSLFCLLLNLCLIQEGYTQCNGRYKNVQFNSVNITSDIQYGQSVKLNGDTVNLKLDVYEPAGDTLAERPLIIFAHGGSFTSGSKNNSDIETICTRMAKRGFVTASINYRLTNPLNLLDSSSIIKEAIMAAQDGKAAIRYFRKDAAINGNQFDIDTDQIFTGGNSAGAILALQLAYGDKRDTTHMNADILSYIQEAGGFEGNSGNPGYSSEVGAVINMSGALKDADYVDGQNPPLLSLHGKNDETVPYGRGKAYQSISAVDITLEGSGVIHPKANDANITNRLKTFYGAGHSPFANDTAYMDTTINVIADFMQKRCDCYQPTGIAFQSSHSKSALDVYPNPAGHQVTIALDQKVNKNDATLRLINHTGQVVRRASVPANQQQITLERRNLSAGFYHVAIREVGNGRIHQQKVLFR